MRQLGAVPSFNQAPAATLEAILAAGYVVRVRPEWPLLAEQTNPDRAYVLLDGMVDVHRAGTDLGPCRPGEILGELGIVRRRLRVATVVTSSAATVLHLSRDAFETLYDEETYFRDLVGEAVQRKSA